MSKLTVSNATINSISVAKIESDFGFIADGITTNGVTINSSSVIVGNVSITPPIISTPSLSIGGVTYTGSQFGGIINYQEFTANGTWSNPYANASVNSALSGHEQVLVMAWGGGGGGYGSASHVSGGGGGACFIGTFKLSDATSTCAVTVGPGGAAQSGNGGNSVFVVNTASTITAFGGRVSPTATYSGAGAGLMGAANTTGGGGAPLGGGSGTTGTSSTLGGGGATTGSPWVGGSSIFGGGAGSTYVAGAIAGNSVYGGGGAGLTTGKSIFGGNGGLVTSSGAGTVGSVPGGGGGSNTTTFGLAGARGEVRVWTFGPALLSTGPGTYAITANTAAVYPGDTILYTVTTTGVSNGTTLYYTLNNSSAAISTDFSSPSNGSFTINSGVGTFSLTANARSFASNTGMTIDIRTGSTTGPIVAANNSTLIRRTPTLTYLSHNFLDGVTAYTDYTITGASLGTAAADRKIVVSLLGYNLMGTGVTCTVAGISATLVYSILNGALPWWDNYVFVADVPTGTTGNIFITNAIGQYGSYSAAVYALYGAGSSTPVSTAFSETASASSLNNVLTNLRKSCVILTSTGQYLSNVTNPMSITVNDPNAVVTTNVNDVQIDTQYAFMVEHAIISNNFNLSTTCTSTFTTATDAAVSSSVAFR